VPILTVFALGNDAVLLPGGEVTALALAALGCGIIVAAVGTWQGSRRACIALLGLLTIYYGLHMLGNLRLATSDWVPEAVQTRAWATLGRGVFWLGLNYWYWLRPATRAWFAQQGR